MNKSKKDKAFIKSDSLLVELHIVVVVREVCKPFELGMIILLKVYTSFTFSEVCLYDIIFSQGIGSNFNEPQKTKF